MPLSLNVLAEPVGTMSWSDADFYSWDGDRVRCDLCPIGCRLCDGDHGLCHVRRRNGDRLETATFSSSVFHVDPIERKPLYHFHPGLNLLTLAAPGCTFSCSYCQNYRISQFGKTPNSIWSARPVSADALVDRAKQAGCGIAFSYSEPSLALELTVAVAKIALQQLMPLPIVWKTNGFLTKMSRRVAAGCLSGANVDLKCWNSKLHQRLTGAPVEPVVETIREFVDSGVWVEVSTPVIPGFSASADELSGIADTIARISVDIPWHVVRVSPEFRLSSDRPTNVEEVERAVEIGRRAGLRYVYVERALGAAGRATTCRNCGLRVVERGIWNTERVEMNMGMCLGCSAVIPGRW